MHEPLELVLLSFISITFLSVLIGWPAAAVYKKIRRIAPYKSPLPAKVAHAISIGTIIGYIIFLLGSTFSLGMVVSVGVWICRISVYLSLPFLLVSWSKGYWSRPWRIHQSFVTLAGIGCVYLLQSYS